MRPRRLDTVVYPDFLESRTRRAAEATPILIDAVRGVSFNDAVAILRGGDTAATDVLPSKTEGSLEAVFEPIITTKMDEAGVTHSYERLMEQAGGLMAMLGGGSELDLPTPRRVAAYAPRKALLRCRLPGWTVCSGVRIRGTQLDSTELR